MSTPKLACGQAAPDFHLHSLGGQELSLWGCLLEGPVLVEFIRGTWCPNARRRLPELAAREKDFEALGARLLLIVCEDPFTVERYFAHHPCPFAILIDRERETAKAYGVHVRFGLDGWNVARPASFVIDRAGFLRYIFVSKLQTEAAPIEELLASLRAVEVERGP